MSVFILCIFINAYRFDYGPKDAFFRTLLFPFEGTVWSDNFSEKAFSKVEIKMDMKSVVNLLGDPVAKSQNCIERCFWYYTWHDTGTADFDQRWVIFGTDQKVVEIKKSFFID